MFKPTVLYSGMSSLDQSAMSIFRPTPICRHWIKYHCLHPGLPRYVPVGLLDHVSIQAYSDMPLLLDQSTMSPLRPTPTYHRWVNLPWRRQRSLQEGEICGVACECLSRACLEKDPISREQFDIEQQGQSLQNIRDVVGACQMLSLLLSSTKLIDLELNGKLAIFNGVSLGHTTTAVDCSGSRTSPIPGDAKKSTK